MTTYGDYDICKEEANAFLDTAKMCNEKWNGFPGEILYPLVVNCVFACELYMKAIIIHDNANNETRLGHNLNKIFNDLPLSTQKRLSNKYKQIYNEELSALLDESGNSFINWRYAYEKGCGINITKAMKFAEILKEYVSSI